MGRMHENQRYKSKLLWAASICCLSLVLVSCLGSGMKTLTSKTATDPNNTTPTNNANSFTVNLAYRDSSQDAGTPIRIVSVQGVTGVSSASFQNICGVNGASCTCTFYTNASGSGAQSSSAVAYSTANNTINCTIGGASAPSSYTYVQLQSTTGTQTTGLISIKSTLTIDDVLGTNLSKTNVRKIFQYGCIFTFLEGEGLATNPGTCPASQKLGLITATYNFYLYQGSGTDLNTNAKGTQHINQNVCSTSIMDQNCLSSPEGNNTLVFGLYNTSVSPYTVQITASPAPGQTGAVIGYAAVPDSNNNCPTGLTLIRPWVATPPSILPGTTYDGGAGSQPAGIFTNFLNSNQSLNNQVFASSSTAPSNFIVTRTPNANPCANGGGPPANSCALATQAGPFTIFSKAYAAQSPLLCVFPASLVQGL